MTEKLTTAELIREFNRLAEEIDELEKGNDYDEIADKLEEFDNIANILEHEHGINMLELNKE